VSPVAGEQEVTETILVDTSVWVSHFRFGEDRLKILLDEEKVACHPFVIGELACGSIKKREEILSLLFALPLVETTTQEEVLVFIERNKMMGKGLGLVDMNLLSSAVLSGSPLWTFDKSLARAAARLKVGKE
jgi:predicted nucleic acid-binding protein